MEGVLSPPGEERRCKGRAGVLLPGSSGRFRPSPRAVTGADHREGPPSRPDQEGPRPSDSDPQLQGPCASVLSPLSDSDLTHSSLSSGRPLVGF